MKKLLVVAVFAALTGANVYMASRLKRNDAIRAIPALIADYKEFHPSETDPAVVMRELSFESMLSSIGLLASHKLEYTQALANEINAVFGPGKTNV